MCNFSTLYQNKKYMWANLQYEAWCAKFEKACEKAHEKEGFDKNDHTSHVIEEIWCFIAQFFKVGGHFNTQIGEIINSWIDLIGWDDIKICDIY